MFSSHDNTVVRQSPNLGPSDSVTPSSFLGSTHAGRGFSCATENRPSVRRSARHQTMSNDTTMRTRCSLQQSILMSPNRTVEDHTSGIIRILNEASERQLQHLPKVGPKTAVIIYNWRLQNGPFKDVSELKKVPGLPPSFMKRFAQANCLVQFEEMF